MNLSCSELCDAVQQEFAFILLYTSVTLLLLSTQTHWYLPSLQRLLFPALSQTGRSALFLDSHPPTQYTS